MNDQTSKDKLVTDLKTLISDAEELLRATTTLAMTRRVAELARQKGMEA